MQSKYKHVHTKPACVCVAEEGEDKVLIKGRNAMMVRKILGTSGMRPGRGANIDRPKHGQTRSLMHTGSVIELYICDALLDGFVWNKINSNYFCKHIEERSGICVKELQIGYVNSLNFMWLSSPWCGH